MRIVVIGGTGHVGTYLIPRLLMAGHQVICISRQKSKPYSKHPIWGSVDHIHIDREKAEAEGSFGRKIKDLKADVVIDMICFTLDSARMLVEAMMGSVQHFLHCGSIWVHGYSEQVPTLENQVRKPLCEYGRGKAEIESYLLEVSRQKGFPATVLHPGHICGPGWLPVNPLGNRNPEVFDSLAKGKEIILPNLGMETLHHVHADDVAQAFECAIDTRTQAFGESFHAVSEQALSLRGYAIGMAEWYGQDANLDFLPWEDWKSKHSEEDASLTWDHISHSPICSIAKAKEKLNYLPKYSSLSAVQESIAHYMEEL